MMLSLLCFMLLTVFLTQDGALSYKLESCRSDDMTFGVCVNFNECEERQDENQFTFLRCRGSKTCCPLSKLVKVTETPLTKVNDNKGCGWSNRVYDIQTTPGSATYGEFPWMIAVLRTSNTNKAWNQQDLIGGGSLIHPSVVLTAAHTVHRLTNEQLKCRAGEWNTQTQNEFYPYQERNVKKIIIHPDFHSRRGHNDVALLFLESSYDISSTISVACLGRTMAQVGTDCYSMGWGQRVFNNTDDHAVLLKKVPLPIVARRTCEYYLKNTILGSKFKLHDSLICAGGLQGVDTCTKDGGSPLVCPIGNVNGVSRYAVYGVVAFGIQCGQENVPGVYSSVPNVYEWLVATMVGEGMDTSQFVY